MCSDVENASKAASGRARAREDSVGRRDSRAADQMPCARGHRHTGQGPPEHVTQQVGMVAARLPCPGLGETKVD
jgi:hypothetical protein